MQKRMGKDAMKNKPILLKRLTQDNRGRYREVIGLIGTHHGVGVTHTGMLLAFYYGEVLGKKTAILECNQHRDMHLIQSAYEWNQSEAGSFSFHRITCYQEVKTSQITQIFGDDYEVIIMDFGTDLTSNMEELLRCTTKIVIGGSSEWDIPKLKDFISKTEKLHGSEHWLYCLPRCSERTVNVLRREVKRRIWAVPEAQEPTRPNYNVKQFFKQILNAK